jgi:hypothetical protein
VTGAEATAVKILEFLAKWSVGWLWRWMRPDTSRTALIADADDLAGAVDRRETVLIEQLGGGRNMVVGDLEFRAELRLRLAAGDAVGVLKDIGPYFRRQATRRLVVLGEAGAGKTVAVVHLVLDQLDHRKTLRDAVRADEPVPVRVNAAGWDGSTDFTSWLAHQLAIDYGLNPRVARAMVKDDRILPVLDGLDEMDPPDAKPVLASAALERLNKLPWQNRGVVVACRSRVYEAIRDLRPDAGLQFATTVTLQPLTAEDIYFYLEQYRDGLGIKEEAAWAPVTDQLDQADGVLATALRTPWLLSLAAAALKPGGNETADELATCSDTAQIRERLFESLIPAAVDAIPETDSTPNYSEKNVQRWLRTLAQHLEQRRTDHSGGTQIALDQIWHLAGTHTCRALHAVIGGLVVGLAAALVAVVPFPTKEIQISSGPNAHNVSATIIIHQSAEPSIFGHPLGTSTALIGSLVVAIVTGLACAIASARADIGRQRTRIPKRIAWRARGVSRRFAWRVPGRSRWRRGLVRGIAVGLPVSLVGFLLLKYLQFHTNPEARIAFPTSITLVLAVGLALGLAFGLVSGLGTTSEERLALGQDARRLIHDDLMSGLVIWLILLVACVTIVSADMPESNLSFWDCAGWGRRFAFELSVTCTDSHGRPASYHQTLAVVLDDWAYWLLTWLPLELALATMFAALSAVASGRYAIASLLFGFTRVLPRRPGQFLEWARDAGLLRVTGIAYQFRHDTYGEWLAAGGGNRDGTVRSDTPADTRSG